MASTNTQSRPSRANRHQRIGHGAHSEVFHRPGSAWVIQIFHPNTPLTRQRVTWEYDYLRQTYAALPDLIGPQRLLARDSAAPLVHGVLVKRFVDVDPIKALLHLRPDELPEAYRQQLAQFVTVTRGLLACPLVGDIPTTGVPRLPDIIDDEFRNLAFDRSGRLRLLDTNELISTAHLYELIGTDTPLDLDRRRIHAKFFARLLQLETLTGRDSAELVADPLYRGYLTAEQITALLNAPTAQSRRERL